MSTQVSRLPRITADGGVLQVDLPGIRGYQFPLIWLRDSCQCPNCIHPDNKQKLFSSGELDAEAKLDSASVREDLGPEPVLEVRWGGLGLNRESSGGSHTSHYPFSWLTANAPFDASGSPRPHFELPKHQLWSGREFSEVHNFIPYDEFMDPSKGGLYRALVQMAEYGLFFLEGVPIEDSKVTEVASRIGVVYNTFYGASWDVRSVPNAENIAYTSLSLGLHMDLCYFEAPPGLQFLHCLQNSVEGGTSIFLDSFKAAMMFRDRHPDHFAVLEQVPVTFHYYNNNRHFRYRSPTFITTDPNEPLIVRYAPPFQGPMEFGHPDE
ncbi:hypothetical protein EV182_007074, partial [Spiromyces aspiralis]